MSATSTVSADSQTRPRIVIAGAGPAARALVRQLTRTPFAGGITVLSNRDDAPEELLATANKIATEMESLPELRAPRVQGDLVRRVGQIGSGRR